MDRYITHLSPVRSPINAPAHFRGLNEALGINSPLLAPQSPTKPGSPLRSPKRASMLQSTRNLDPPISPIKQAALDKKIEKDKLKLRYMVETPMLRDDFYSTLLATCPVTGLVAVAIRNEVRIWSGQDGAQTPTLPNQWGIITCLAFNEQGLLAIGYNSGVICLYDKSVEVMTTRTRLDDGNYPTCIKFKGNDVLYCGDNHGNIYLLDMVPNHGRKRLKIAKTVSASTDMISGLEFNQTKDLMICGSNDGSISVWRTESRSDKNLNFITSMNHGSAVKAITFLPTVKNIAITGGGRSDRTMRVWDMNEYNELQVINMPAQVTGFAWLSNFELFVALGHARGGPVKVGQVYRIEDGQCKLLFDLIDGTSRTVYCVSTKSELIVGLNSKKLMFYEWKGIPKGNTVGFKQSKSLLIGR